MRVKNREEAATSSRTGLFEPRPVRLDHAESLAGLRASA
jgi:hypothetical protein